MGLKKNNRVNAQFSMSSLTDIIFLLLIFFMLSSSLVAPNALNLKLPGQSTAKKEESKAISEVQVQRNGTYMWNGRQVSLNSLEGELRKMGRAPADQRTFTIAPDKKVPVEHVVSVMDAAMRYRLNAILLPEK